MEKQSPEYVLSQLRYITSLSINAAEAETLEQVLQQIADAARELLNVRYAALGVPNLNGGMKHFKVSGISMSEIAKIHHTPVGEGLLGHIMDSRKPLRISSIQDDSRAGGFPEGHPHMSALLGVPIQIGEQLFGTIYLTDKENGETFTEEDEWLLEMLAASAALAIAGAQIREQQQNLTRLAERERIAMELHDSVIQSLYALGLGLDFASKADNIPKEMIQETLQGLNQVIEDIRKYILKLSSSHGNGHLTLRGHVENLIDDLYIPPNMTLQLDVPGKPTALKSDVIEGVKSIIYECISNAVRHADATCIALKIRESKSHFCLDIIDDGKGFDIDNIEPRGGLGLKNIRKRARLYGGNASVETAPGKGTKISLVIPLIRL